MKTKPTDSRLDELIKAQQENLDSLCTLFGLLTAQYERIKYFYEEIDKELPRKNKAWYVKTYEAGKPKPLH